MTENVSTQPNNLLKDDLANLLTNTTNPIIMLDPQMQIRQVSCITESILNIQASDIGCFLKDVRMPIAIDQIEALVHNVVEKDSSQEAELQDQDGHWHLLRVRPYLTSANQVAGWVLTFIDIHELRNARNDSEMSRLFAETVFGASQTPLVMLRNDLRIKLANPAFHQQYGTKPEETENELFLEINGKRFDLTGLRSALGRMLTDDKGTETLDLEDKSGGKTKHVYVTIRVLQPATEKMLLIALDDITARKEAERELLEEQRRLKEKLEAGYVELQEARKRLHGEMSGREQAESELEESRAELFRSREELRHLSASLLNAHDAERRRVSRELHDDLSQKVAKLQFDIEILEQQVPFSDLEGARAKLRTVRDQAATVSNDLRRVAHQLHPATLDHLGLAVALRAYIHEFSQSTGIKVRLSSNDTPKQLPLHIASCVYRIVQETLRNVAKHSQGTEVDVKLSATSHTLKLLIRDNGIGFDMESARAKGGLGLIGMEERVRLLSGKISFRTRLGAGVSIHIQIPLKRAQG